MLIARGVECDAFLKPFERFAWHAILSNYHDDNFVQEPDRQS
jgi:hypothetical protein